MGKASRRATPVDLSQKPAQPQTWRHKCQPFRDPHTRNSKYLLASFRKTTGFPESGPQLGGRFRAHPPRLTTAKIRKPVRSVRFACQQPPRDPGMASFRKKAPAAPPRVRLRRIFQPQFACRSFLVTDHPKFSLSRQPDESPIVARAAISNSHGGSFVSPAQNG